MTPTTDAERSPKYRFGRTMRFHLGLSDVPNIEGYRFRGWLHNGDLIPCVVQRNELGMHFAVSEESGKGCYDSLKGWTPYLDAAMSLNQEPRT